MLTAGKLIVQGRGLSAVLVRRAATLELGWETRQKSRFDAVDSTGRRIGVFLPRGQVLRGGDVLVAEDGALINVRAAPEPVMTVTPCVGHGSAFDLLRAAYHLGNRHVALELRPDCLLLEPDHVLAALLRRLHLDVVEGLAPFEPESGAYADGASLDDRSHRPSAEPDHDHADHKHRHDH